MKVDLHEKYVTIKQLYHLGWPIEILREVALHGDIDYRVGSSLFRRFWAYSSETLEGRVLLKILLDMVAMPSDLSGSLNETRHLLSHFHPSLSPDDCFWSSLATLVDKSFPGDKLCQEGKLEKRIHQFRYVISSQQAQYVRHHYRKYQQTDGQALANYLSHKRGPSFWRNVADYSLSESSRLHNKLKMTGNQICFPDNQASHNIKILMGFHTEFILASNGRFLNELDAEVITETGIVNGASFNYGTAGPRHWDLDVDPVRRHDPLFRRGVLKDYRSPKHIVKKWSQGQINDFELSYFNHKGAFARKGLSSYRHVKKRCFYFCWKVRFLRWFNLLFAKKEKRN
ncbi:DUF3114 domain-containing protein [Streptococcus porcinus]|uniref:DUF3114 domain-containing protein n=1 Tax=Streptococcus porcinus TaxID=1340 RepID=A0A7W0ARR9_STRPO|nr:DUF3114 domain-containing protein [Streptococcus porcinus]MBA2795366.1 DUF3114 domain-containing protein [Streptococcus porcinus]